MAASFANSSSQYLLNSTPSVTTLPFTFAAWVYPTVVAANRVIFSIGENGGSSNYYIVYQTTGSVWQIESTPGPGGSGGTVTANKWAFLVARFISDSSRRLHVLQYDGSIANIAPAGSGTPANLTRMAIGAFILATPSLYYDGSIAEFWLTNSDIQPDGGVLAPATLRQLAYGGPFSIPHIAQDIIEYRSLRKYPSTDGDEIGEVYSGSLGPQTWANNGATTGPHPPLPYWYEKPEQYRRELVI